MSLFDRLELSKKKPTTATCLLLDVSLSMDENDGAGRRIDLLIEAIEKIGTSVPMFAFNSSCWKVESPHDLQPRGGTHYGQALGTVAEYGHKSIVFITDGECYDAEEALRVAQGLHLDIIYVGPPPMPAILEKLAKASFKGTLQIGELKKPLELEAVIKGFLPPTEKGGK